MKHSLLNGSLMPPTIALKRKLQSLAMLDAILMADWNLRYFSFNSKWGPGEMMASMRDGEGGDFFFLFNPAGSVGKIYCKESALGSNAASVLAAVPAEYSSFLNEPAFNVNVATCYLWQHSGDNGWSVAPVGTVEIPYLAFIGDQGEHYRAWASDYYERELSSEGVGALFRHQVLTSELVKAINADVDIAGVRTDAEEIGYPH